MISYAQNFEDVMLRRVFRDRKDGFYIDIGAMDPVNDSVTKFFYDEGWSGINVEPNEFFYNRLMAERPRDINLKLAVGDKEEERTLHLFERIGNSTFDEPSRDRYEHRGFESVPTVVKVTSLASICEQYVTRTIDFLKVDCEGWESAVLRGADWDGFRTTVLIVEATEPGTTTPSWSEWEEPLLKYFEMVYFDGLNRFYLNRDSVDLRVYFELPPNFHDEITMHATAEAEWASHVHRTESEALARQVTEIQESIRSALGSAEQALQAVISERDGLAKTVKGLEQLRGDQEARIITLEQEYRRARLWVGQLSQELAAAKQ